jgi:hypothetical protein
MCLFKEPEIINPSKTMSKLHYNPRHIQSSVLGSEPTGTHKQTFVSVLNDSASRRSHSLTRMRVCPLQYATVFVEYIYICVCVCVCVCVFVPLHIYMKFGTYSYLESTVYAWYIYGLRLSRPCTAV